MAEEKEMLQEMLNRLRKEEADLNNECMRLNHELFPLSNLKDIDACGSREVSRLRMRRIIKIYNRLDEIQMLTRYLTKELAEE